MDHHRRRRKHKPSWKGRVMRAFEEAARPLWAAELLELMKIGQDQAEAVNTLGGATGQPGETGLAEGRPHRPAREDEPGDRGTIGPPRRLRFRHPGDRRPGHLHHRHQPERGLARRPVVVRIEGTRGRRRREGKIIRVLERRHKEVLGLLGRRKYLLRRARRRAPHLQPDHSPEQLAGAAVGDMVRAAVTNYPTGHLNPRGPSSRSWAQWKTPRSRPGCHPEIRPAG